MFQNWFKIKDGAAYAGVKPRMVSGWIKDGLRHSRLPSGTILIKREWIDGFLQKHEVKENQIDEIVRAVMKDLQ